MTLRDAITKNRKEFWKDADSEQMGEELELIIERIDELEKRITEYLPFVTSGGMIRVTSPTEPPEPFSGYNELIEEALPVLKAAIAEKKRQLAHKVVPMTVLED